MSRTEHEAPIEQKLRVVEAEIVEYCRVKYQAEMRSRISLKIGDTQGLESLKADLVRIHTALEVLDAEKKELEASLRAPVA